MADAKIKQVGDRLDITAGIELHKQAKLEYGEVEVVVSNSGMDRHGEKIMLEGIDLSQVKRNPVVLWAHDYMGLPIATISKLWKSSGNLMAKIKFATDIYDFADTVYKLVQAGFINAVSIGGIVRKWNEDYTVVEKLEMVELSVVPVGAHPDALVTAKALNMEPDTFKRQYEDFVHKTLTERVKALPHNEIATHIKSLKSLVSALETSYEESADTDKSETPTEGKQAKKLILLRSAAKQCDKQAELVIAAINNKLLSK